VVLTIGQFASGSAWNVIPESALLRGTIRTFNLNLFDQLPKKMKLMVHNMAAAFDCQVELNFRKITIPLINDEKVAALVEKAATKAVGKEQVITQFQTMGSEDFAYIADQIPSCFFFVGAHDEKNGCIHPHHSPYFKIDEAGLKIGAQVFLNVLAEVHAI